MTLSFAALLTGNGNADEKPTNSDDPISSTVFGAECIDTGTQTLYLHSGVSSIFRSYITGASTGTARSLGYPSSPDAQSLVNMAAEERRARTEEERLSAKLRQRSVTSLASLLSSERADKLLEEDAEVLQESTSSGDKPAMMTHLPIDQIKPTRSPEEAQHKFIPSPPLPSARILPPSFNRRNSALSALMMIYKTDPNEIRNGLLMFKEATGIDLDGACKHLFLFQENTNALVEKAIRFLGGRNKDLRTKLGEDQLQLLLNHLQDKAKRLVGIKYLGLDFLQNKLLHIKQLHLQPKDNYEILKQAELHRDDEEQQVMVSVQRWRLDVGLILRQLSNAIQQLNDLNQSVLIAHVEEYSVLCELIRKTRLLKSSAASGISLAQKPSVSRTVKMPAEHIDGRVDSSTRLPSSGGVLLAVSGLKVNEPLPRKTIGGNKTLQSHSSVERDVSSVSSAFRQLGEPSVSGSKFVGIRPGQSLTKTFANGEREKRFDNSLTVVPQQTSSRPQLGSKSSSKALFPGKISVDLKTDSVSLSSGEKPVIALTSTMPGNKRRTGKLPRLEKHGANLSQHATDDIGSQPRNLNSKSTQRKPFAKTTPKSKQNNNANKNQMAKNLSS